MHTTRTAPRADAHTDAASSRDAGLDALRGLTLLSMAAYHVCWDLVYLFGVPWGWYRSFAAHLWQQSICWTFLLLSGYCTRLGRHPLRRGAVVFLWGAVVWGVTELWMPENRVFFGVLSLLGAAMMLTGLLRPLLRRVPARLGLAVCFGLFLLTRDAGSGFLGFEGLRAAPLPPELYRDLSTAALGFPPRSFYSTDYFPLVPWLFLFWTGYFLYPLRRGEETRRRFPRLAALGRRSLPLYLLHQPVIYAILWLCFRVW